MYIFFWIYVILISGTVLWGLASLITSWENEKRHLKYLLRQYKNELPSIILLGIIPVFVLWFSSDCDFPTFKVKIDKFLTIYEIFIYLLIMYGLSLILRRFSGGSRNRSYIRSLKIFKSSIKGPFYAISGLFISSTLIGFSEADWSWQNLLLSTFLLTIGIFLSGFSILAEMAFHPRQK